ncbi:MAG TPA: hypothetical protein VN658_02325 [Candidatus Acidoferrales bacterium]|nr:hypothetical protein [Candidatus Acidoferrales bacterium]
MVVLIGREKWEKQLVENAQLVFSVSVMAKRIPAFNSADSVKRSTTLNPNREDGVEKVLPNQAVGGNNEL